MHENSVRLAEVMPFIQERLAAGESVKFTPHGTSMLPMILGGRDQVVLSPMPSQWKKYDLPLYQRDNGQFVLHRIVKVGDTFTCIGDNQFSYETGIRPDQMIAVVTAFVRSGREHRVDTLSHRCYRCLWHHSRGLRYIGRILWGRLRRIVKGEPMNKAR